jgi:succinyl-diaminopimelate desuccinylase
MVIDSNLRQKVISNINKDDVIRLSQELIRIPSPTGEEKAVSDFICTLMMKMGLEVRQAESEPGRPNAIGFRRGAGPGPTVMFSGHMDTVGISNPETWITNPFGGEVIDGKLYGRGSMDSKGGGIASILIALSAIQKAGISLKGNILVVGTVDEEVGGRKGMQFLVKSQAIKPDMVVYCVHSDMEIKAHFKGVAWLHWTVRGQTAHGSMPHRGVNSLTRAARLITILDESCGLPYERHPILGDHTINFGWITAGGENPRYNMVADKCEFGIDMRLVPVQSTQFVEEYLQTIIEEQKKQDPDLDVSFDFYTQREPRSVSEDEEILQIVKRAATEIMGHSPIIGGTISTGDLTAILDAGIPGIGFGPGDLEKGNAHKENEFIEVEQLVSATKIYALTMLEACGVV